MRKKRKINHTLFKMKIKNTSKPEKARKMIVQKNDESLLKYHFVLL